MFSILEYRQTSSDRKLVDVRHSSKPRTRGPHLACWACHSKKVKCSGQKDGCNRCKARSIPCTYTRSKKVAAGSEANSRTPNRATEPSQFPSPQDSTHELSGISSLAGDNFGDEWQNMSSWLLDAWTDANSREGGVSAVQQSMMGEQPQKETLQTAGGAFASENSQAVVDGTAMLASVEKNQNALISAATPSPSRDPQWMELSGMGQNGQHPYSLPDYDLTTMLSTSDHLPSQRSPQICLGATDNICSETAGSTDTSCDSLRIDGPQLSSPPATRSTSASACSECANNAFQVLGDLQISNSKSAPTSFDGLLNLKKESLDQCFRIMDCPDCAASTTVITLLTAICERLLISFEIWERLYRERSAARLEACLEKGESSGALQSFFLGVYEVGVGDEQCSILRALAMVQLRRLTRLLGRMIDVAVTREWAERKRALDSFVSRIEGTATGLIKRF
ncbi:hypothetical protein FQN54_008015 [Arachnomyces sp. PD_36]|nr:hypothetical protein FQN54_008015 [Arachnomyces sp. PD_36]